MAKPRDISGVEPKLFREKEPSLKILHHRNGSVRGYEKPLPVPEPSVRKAGERFGRHPIPSFLKEKSDTPQIGTLAPVPIVVLDTEAVDMAKLHEFSAPTSPDATNTTEAAPHPQPPEPTPAQAEAQALVEAVVHKREAASIETDTEIDSDTQELLRSVERRFWRRVGAFLLLSLGLAVGVGVLFIALRARRAPVEAPRDMTPALVQAADKPEAAAGPTPTAVTPDPTHPAASLPVTPRPAPPAVASKHITKAQPASPADRTTVAEPADTAKVNPYVPGVIATGAPETAPSSALGESPSNERAKPSSKAPDVPTDAERGMPLPAPERPTQANDFVKGVWD